MGKSSRSGLGIGVGTSPQSSISNRNFEHKEQQLIKKETMLKPLINAKLKFNAKDVLFVTKDESNQMIWLEKGNNGAGLNHILSKHANDFLRKHSVTSENIANHINEIVTKGKIEYSRIKSNGTYERFEKLYLHNNEYYLLTGIGANGFIVSAYPVREKEAIKLKRRYKK